MFQVQYFLNARLSNLQAVLSCQGDIEIPVTPAGERLSSKYFRLILCKGFRNGCKMKNNSDGIILLCKLSKQEIHH